MSLDKFLQNEVIKEKLKIKPKKGINYWSNEDVVYLKQNYYLVDNRIIANKLNRSISALINKAYTLNLKKHAVFSGVNSGCWKKGQESWSKGTKGLLKPNKTSFTKGHIPANSHKIGTIVTRRDSSNRSYKYIKIYKGMVLYHRWFYEKYIGKINKGNIVVFKDGNCDNVVADNLLQITKAQNVCRNYNFKKVLETKTKKREIRIAKEAYYKNCR